MSNDLNVLALVKGPEHFIFVYDDDSRGQVIATFREMAADADVNLSWFDAMVLTTKAHEQETAVAEPMEQRPAGNRIHTPNGDE